MRRGVARAFTVSTVGVLVAAGSATAAPVRGSVQDAPAKVQPELLGFTRTRVAGPSTQLAEAPRFTAIFLQVEESLPIPKPEVPTQMSIQGLRLVPDIATCAVDSKVDIVNDDATAVTVLVGDLELKLEPGERRSYECTVGDPQRAVRIKEWPHVRGTVYVGEVGVAASIDERGNFALAAPDGKYALLVINRDGVVERRAVEVKGAAVNVGRIDLAAETEAGSEAP